MYQKVNSDLFEKSHKFLLYSYISSILQLHVIPKAILFYWNV